MGMKSLQTRRSGAIPGRALCPILRETGQHSNPCRDLSKVHGPLALFHQTSACPTPPFHFFITHSRHLLYLSPCHSYKLFLDHLSPASSAEPVSVSLPPRTGHGKTSIRKRSGHKSIQHLSDVPRQPGDQPYPFGLYLSGQPAADAATEKKINPGLP